MSAEVFIFTIFFHTPASIFKAESVENQEKTRNSTTMSVDNYVDGVDRTVNIHQKAKNIYTSTFPRIVQPAACENLHNCKTIWLIPAGARGICSLCVIVNTQPSRNECAGCNRT